MLKICLKVLLFFIIFSLSFTLEKNELKNYLFEEVTSKEVAENLYIDIVRFSKKYEVDPLLVVSIIKIESNFRLNAISEGGAIGFMQLMPRTALELKIDPFNAEENILGGVKYLKRCLTQNGNDISLGLASYNAGQGNVLKHGGIPPFPETLKYVEEVIKLYNSFGSKYEINKIEYEEDKSLSF